MILPIEQQVASRELSERLKELGFPQDTLWWWVFDKIELASNAIKRSEFIQDNYCAAPTSAEIGMFLSAGYQDAPDYRAKTLIYRVEQGLVKFEKEAL